MSGTSIPLAGTAVNPWALSQAYNNALATAASAGLTQAETGEAQARIPYVQAQTVGQQIQNELSQFMLGARQAGYAGATAGANTDEPLPGQGAGTASGYAQPRGAPGTGNQLQQLTAAAESGGDPTAVNSLGYSGKYQFGKSALIDAGVYQPAKGEDLTQAGQQPGQWWGTFNLPGRAPMTYQQWLNDPSAQDASWQAHTANLDHEIQARGLNKYIGQTVGGVPITYDALIEMMHGGGPAGTQKFLESGGQYNPADKNQTTIAGFGMRVARAQAAPATPGGPQPYQVAGPAVAAPGAGEPAPQGGNALAQAPVPGAQPGQPNQLSQVGNPMGTSRAGTVVRGVAIPGSAWGLTWLSPDPVKAQNELMADRRATIATVASEATDPQSWDQGVEQLWRQGYLTNGEYAHFHGNFSPGLRDQVIRGQGSAESQTGFQGTLAGKGLAVGQGGQIGVSTPLLGAEPPREITVPVRNADGSISYQKQQVTAPSYAAATAPLVLGPAGQPVGGGAGAPPPAGAPAPAAAGGTGQTAASVPGAAPGAPAGMQVVGAEAPQLTPQAQAQLEVQKQGQEAEVNKIRGAYGDQAAAVVQAAQAAPVTLERLDALQNAVESFRPSPTGPIRAAGLKRLQDALQLVHAPVPEWLNEQTTGSDVINKLGSFMAANMVKVMGEKAASVFDAVKNIQPNIEQSSGGFQAVLNSVRMDTLRDRDLGAFQEDWLKTHDSTSGMQTAFNQQHPIQVYASWVVPYPVPTTQVDGKTSVDTGKLIPNVIYANSKGLRQRWSGTQFEPVPLHP